MNCVENSAAIADRGWKNILPVYRAIPGAVPRLNAIVDRFNTHQCVELAGVSIVLLFRFDWTRVTFFAAPGGQKQGRYQQRQAVVVPNRCLLIRYFRNRRIFRTSIRAT